MKSVPILVINRHTFREMAKMTKNKKLRMIYAKMAARYYRMENKSAL